MTYRIYKVVVHSDGSTFWFWGGKRHREDGPAIEKFDGTKRYYLEGLEFNEKEYWEEIQRRKNNCSLGGKTLEIDGKRYELKEIS